MALAIQALPALLLLSTAPGWALAPSVPAPVTSAPGTTPLSVPRSRDDDNAALVDQAKSYFASGNEHYAAGRYQEAIRDFQAGYALVPRPNFLVNLGQSYRKVGDLTRAKEAYLAYVRALPQDSTLRDQALQVLAEIEVQLQERRPEEPATPVPVPPPPAAPAVIEKAGGGAGAWPWVTGGVGLALAGAGTFFELRARSAGDRLTELTREGGFYDPELEERGRRDQKFGAALLVGGGLALGTAAVIWILSKDTPVNGNAERARAVRRGWNLALGQGAGLKLRF